MDWVQYFIMLKINNEIKLHSSELSETFLLASGPGGQHVNKVETKVELRFEAEKSMHLSEATKSKLKKIAGRKWSKNGVLIVTAEKYRSQEMNRVLAREKLVKLILQALKNPNRRMQTKPSKIVKIRRAHEKEKRSKLKNLRGRIQYE